MSIETRMGSISEGAMHPIAYIRKPNGCMSRNSLPLT